MGIGTRNGVFMLNRIGLVAALLLVACASAYAQNQTAPVDSGNSVALPLYMSDSDQPLDIHGYVETQAKSSHISARGTVFADKGVEVQPVGALTFNLYQGTTLVDKVSATAGVFNSVNTSLRIPNAGPWFDIEYFARMNLEVADRVNFYVQYIAFDSPGAAFATDNNVEFMLSYNDMGKMMKDFAIHPYTKLFYNVSGASTTVFGRNGNTFDVELGFIPTYIWKPVPNYPITFTLPTYVTVGPKHFWGGSSNVGIFTTSLAASFPISCIPSRYGHWHLDASASYFDLINTQLVNAALALGNSGDRSRFVGEIGMGFDF